MAARSSVWTIQSDTDYNTANTVTVFPAAHCTRENIASVLTPSLIKLATAGVVYISYRVHQNRPVGVLLNLQTGIEHQSRPSVVT